MVFIVIVLLFSFYLHVRNTGTRGHSIRQWGENNDFRIGLNDSPIVTPSVIYSWSTFSNSGVKSLCQTLKNTVVLTGDNEIYVWGSKDHSIIEDKTLIPVKVVGSIENGTNLEISCGYSSVMYRIVDKPIYNLYGWGKNAEGELGDTTSSSVSTPKSILSLGVNLFSVSRFTTLLTVRGDDVEYVYTAGSQNQDTLGWSSGSNRFTFDIVDTGYAGSSFVFKIFNFEDTVFVLYEDHSLFGWGASTLRLTLGESSSQRTPTEITFFTSNNFRIIDLVCNEYCLALVNCLTCETSNPPKNRVLSWGPEGTWRNYFLGRNDEVDNSIPSDINYGFFANTQYSVQKIGSEEITHISSTDNGFLMLTNTGRLLGFGKNDHYMFGRPGTSFKSNEMIDLFDGVSNLYLRNFTFLPRKMNNEFFSVLTGPMCSGFAFTSSDAKEICHGHGGCGSGNVCECDSGYFGDFCNITTCGGFFSNSSNGEVCGGGKCTIQNKCTCLENANRYGLLCDEIIGKSPAKIFLKRKRIELDYQAPWEVLESEGFNSSFACGLLVRDSHRFGDCGGSKCCYFLKKTNGRRAVEYSKTLVMQLGEDHTIYEYSVISVSPVSNREEFVSVSAILDESELVPEEVNPLGSGDDSGGVSDLNYLWFLMLLNFPICICCVCFFFLFFFLFSIIFYACTVIFFVSFGCVGFSIFSLLFGCCCVYSTGVTSSVGLVSAGKTTPSFDSSKRSSSPVPPIPERREGLPTNKKKRGKLKDLSSPNNKEEKELDVLTFYNRSPHRYDEGNGKSGRKKKKKKKMGLAESISPTLDEMSIDVQNRKKMRNRLSLKNPLALGDIKLDLKLKIPKSSSLENSKGGSRLRKRKKSVTVIVDPRLFEVKINQMSIIRKLGNGEHFVIRNTKGEPDSDGNETTYYNLQRFEVNWNEKSHQMLSIHFPQIFGDHETYQFFESTVLQMKNFEISHPNLLKYYGSSILSYSVTKNKPETIGILTEFTRFGNLKSFFHSVDIVYPSGGASRGGGISFQERLEILYSIADAMCYLHAQDHVIYELKPENIYLTEKKQVKINPFLFYRSEDLLSSSTFSTGSSPTKKKSPDSLFGVERKGSKSPVPRKKKSGRFGFSRGRRGRSRRSLSVGSMSFVDVLKSSRKVIEEDVDLTEVEEDDGDPEEIGMDIAKGDLSIPQNKKKKKSKRLAEKEKDNPHHDSSESSERGRRRKDSEKKNGIQNNEPLVTSKDQSRGSLFYHLSPERLRGDCEKVNQKSDVFSFGMLIYMVISSDFCHPYGKFTFLKNDWNSLRARICNNPQFRPKIRVGDYYQKKWLLDLTRICWSEDITLRPSFSDIIGKWFEKNNWQEIKIKEKGWYRRSQDWKKDFLNFSGASSPHHHHGPVMNPFLSESRRSPGGITASTSSPSLRSMQSVDETRIMKKLSSPTFPSPDTRRFSIGNSHLINFENNVIVPPRDNGSFHERSSSINRRGSKTPTASPRNSLEIGGLDFEELKRAKHRSAIVSPDSNIFNLISEHMKHVGNGIGSSPVVRRNIRTRRDSLYSPTTLTKKSKEFNERIEKSDIIVELFKEKLEKKEREWESLLSQKVLELEVSSKRIRELVEERNHLDSGGKKKVAREYSEDIDIRDIQVNREKEEEQEGEGEEDDDSRVQFLRMIEDNKRKKQVKERSEESEEEGSDDSTETEEEEEEEVILEESEEEIDSESSSDVESGSDDDDDDDQTGFASESSSSEDD